VVAPAHEACDDPLHATYYTQNPTSSDCKPTCEKASYCGDGVIDSDWGEQCDNTTAENVGGYGGCNPDCTLVTYWGDGIVQKSDGEECDAGPLNGHGANCTLSCKIPQVGASRPRFSCVTAAPNSLKPQYH